ncbi:MAG: thiamine pyrophosphate-binding protein [Lachnospiraceae bacterium]|nr:thiamine pyrophosphate-binding protein [Lachnospiraceae bacterium]
MEMKVAKYISDFLVKQGVTDCFLVTGGGAMHLNDALGHQEGLHCVFNHHEQASSIAAEGYARLTGRIAALCVTSGPGGTNAITGVMGAYLDSIPMFVVSGQVKRETTIHACPELGLRQLGDQEFDIVPSVSNMTKYAVRLQDPARTAYEIEKAWYLALHGRPGPVWIDVPLDVQGARIETEELIHFDPEEEIAAARSLGDEDLLAEFGEVPAVSDETADAVLAKIRQAKAPLLLAGTGIRLGGAEEELLKLLDVLKIPVVTAWNANDTVAADHPCFAGMPGTVGTRPGNFAVQNCDLLVSLGCRLNIRMIGYNHFDFAKNAEKIIVDIDPKELKKPTIRPDMPVWADVKDFIGALLRAAARRVAQGCTGLECFPAGDHRDWLAWCKDLVTRYPAADPAYRKPEGGTIDPYIFMDMLSDHLRTDDRIICGNGSACVITFQALRVKQGQRMFTNSGCAAMGYGFPAAVGAAVADRAYAAASSDGSRAASSKRIVCIDGDGSFMMNLQELATVAQNRLNIKIILLNNNGYHSIRQTQRNLFQPPFIGIDPASGVSFPDFRILAQAFGVGYFRLDTEANCGPVLEEALNGEGPCIIEAVVDPERNFQPKSSSKVLPDGRIVSPSLDDMAPFLPREEFEAIRFLKD